MSEEMTNDFDRDLKEMEAECRVEVQQGDTSLWIAGSSAKLVAEAKRMLQDMLQFYLADEFLLLTGLKPDVIDLLHEDEDLRALMARPDCVVALDPKEGTVWICGRCR